MSTGQNHADGSHQTTDELRAIVRSVISEVSSLEKERLEPAYKAEFLDEKKKREQLERRVNELVEENKRSRSLAEQAERYAQIRTELQRHGVAKVDLAFKALKEDVSRSGDGRLVAMSRDGEVALGEYVAKFVQENPELLPARIAGGSGATSLPSGLQPLTSGPFDVGKIRPGMDPAEMARIREEVARMAHQALAGGL